MPRRNSKLKMQARMKRSIGTTTIVLLVTLAACSSSPTPSASQQAALAKTELHFDLNACQGLERACISARPWTSRYVTLTITAKYSAFVSGLRVASSSRPRAQGNLRSAGCSKARRLMHPAENRHRHSGPVHALHYAAGGGISNTTGWHPLGTMRSSHPARRIR